MLSVSGRNPAVQEFADMFEFGHLPSGLPKRVSALFHEHAQELIDNLPDSQRLVDALHRLWESKNEAVFLAVRTAKLAAEVQPRD
jgi:hypothetical protein